MHIRRFGCLAFGYLVVACSGTTITQNTVESNGGTTSSGGASLASGGNAAAGSVATGGASTSATGGTTLPATTAPSGGATSSGGTTSSGGGTSTASPTGGTRSAGGTTATGGTNSATGGSSNTGGATSTGGSAAAGGTTVAGGATNTGGTSLGIGGSSPSTGGTPATQQPATCPSPAWKGGTNPIIDDFEDGDGGIVPVDNRIGWWFAASDGTAGTMTPAPNTTFNPSTPGRPNNGYALHVAGSGFTSWGSLVGTSLVVAKSSQCPFDASAFKGITFWAKGTGTLRAQVTISATETVANGGTCTAKCDDVHGAPVRLGAGWQQYSYRWIDLTQQGWGTAVAFDPKTILAFQLNSPQNTQFDYWIDDVAFLTGDVTSCPTGLSLCGGGCVDEQVDSNHCGSCTTACPAGEHCSAGGCTGCGPYAVAAGGYVTSYRWQGFAWTGASPNADTIPAVSPPYTTVSPSDFSALAAGGQLCAQGSVAATADYSGIGYLGFNLNQQVGSSTYGTYTPTGTGIDFDISNTGGSVLRLQIQAADGATNPNHHWCANITTASGTIPWATFNTQCWSPATGVAYTGQALTQLMLFVPGGNTAAVPYNFCINGLSETGVTTCGP